MDGMLSASSQLQDSIVKFSDLGKWPRGTAQCPNLVHAAAPHKKVHLWCPTCHNGINSLPSVVILKPVLPIRDKTWEIFHISMSGGGFSYHNLFLWFGLKPMLSSPYQVKDEILRDLCID